MPSYKLISKEREEKKGGGVGFLIDEKLIYSMNNQVIKCNKCMDQTTIEIRRIKENVMLSSIYRPPNTSARDLVKEYGDLVTDLKKKNSVVTS